MKAWIDAARPRTLPLAISGILTGGGLALFLKPLDFFWPLFGLLILTAILLQVLSNFANDYGDFTKGTDNDDRIGPTRALQSGAIQPKAMKMALVVTALLCLASGLSALYLRAGDDLFSPVFLSFIALGLLAIWAAVQYTVGKKAYGYYGMGDVFVVLFFGFVAVMGSCWLLTDPDLYLTRTLRFWAIQMAPFALAIGVFSAMVLNLNNMRDVVNDEAAGKRTLPVKMGLENAKTYHAGLLLIGWMMITLSFVFNLNKPLHLIWFAPAVVFVPHIKRVIATEEPGALDPELKKIALATFGFAVLFFLTALLS